MVNIWAVLVCTLLSIVVGSIWYGPFFGKTWMKIIHHNSKGNNINPTPLYFVQMLTSFVQIFTLAYLLKSLSFGYELRNTMIIFAGLILTGIITANLWNNQTKSNLLSTLALQGGYHLIMFLIYGLILNFWR